MIDSPTVTAVCSLALEAQPSDIPTVADDPFAALREELRALVPYGSASAAAREMNISVSHLHGILNGTSDAGPEVRQKIARFVAERRKTVSDTTKSVLDQTLQGVDSVTSLGPAPGHPTGQEVTVIVPTPYHAALCNLLSTLPVPVILQMIPEAVRRAEEERQKHPDPSGSDPGKPGPEKP